MNTNIKELHIGSIIKDYTELKSQHSSVMLIGIISTYYILINYSSTNIDIFTYINLAFFILVEILYIYSIARIKNASSNIKSAVNSIKFTNVFIARNDIEGFVSDTYEHYSKTRKSVNIAKDKNKDNKNKDNKNKDDEKEKLIIEDIVIDKKIDYIKDKALRIIIKTSENADSIDWMILNTKLAEE